MLVRELLSRPLPALLFRPNSDTPSLNQKPWTNGFEQVHPRYHPLNENTLRNQEQFGPHNREDYIRLNRSVNGQGHGNREVIANEGDVRRVFASHLSGPVREAWSESPFLIERWESGPLGQTHFSGTVDALFSYYHPDEPEQCVVVGELKHNVINESHWIHDSNTVIRKRLGKELRG